MSRTPHHRHRRVRSSHAEAAVPSAAAADAYEVNAARAVDAALRATRDAAINARLDSAEHVSPRPFGRPSRLSRALRRVGANSIVGGAAAIETVSSWSSDCESESIATVHAEALAEPRSDDGQAAAAPAVGESLCSDAACHDAHALESTVWELSELVANARQMVLARRYRPPLDDAHSAALCAAAGRLANEARRSGCRRIAVVRADGGESTGAWCGALAASLAALDGGRVLYVESTETLTDASIDAIDDDRTIAWLDGKLDWTRAVSSINDLGFDALAASRDLFQRRAACRECDRRAWLEAVSGYAFVLFDACQWRHAAAPADLPPVDAVVLSVELEKTPKRSAHEAQARWTQERVRVLGSLALKPLAA